MAGRRLEITWQEQDSAAALHEQYRGEPEGEVRTRLHGLWLLRQGWSIRAVSAAVGVHYRTVQRWVDWYRQGGVAAVRVHHGGGHGSAGWLSAEQEAALAAHAVTGAIYTAADARRWVAEQCGVHYRPKGIYRLLHRLHCHPKVPRPLHAQADLEAQDAWKKGDVRPPLVRQA